MTLNSTFSVSPTRVQPHRRRRPPAVARLALLATVPALLAVALGAQATSGPALASTIRSSSALPSSLQEFANCPVNNPKVNYCLAAASTGTFKINSTTLTETSPIKLILGLIGHSNGTYSVVLPDNGRPAMVAPPMNVPGGLLGIPGASGPIAVTATPQLVGLPTFSLFNLETTKGTAISLPSDVLLGNALLGTTCTVGSPTAPTTLNLTDGKTHPPAPNKPITGSLGSSIKVDKYGVLRVTCTVLVDNSFAVPGTAGCGPLGILDPIINQQKGFPSAAGTNTVVLKGSSGLAPASVIRKYLG